VSLVDVRQLDPSTRLHAAEAIRTMSDFDLGRLDNFNDQPCTAHRPTIQHGCRACGIRLRQHQRVGIAWLYMRGKGLIADQVGLGKTAQAAGLIAAAIEAGEYDAGEHAVVICRPAALRQWVRELTRFLPGVTIESAIGTAARRHRLYRDPAFTVLVIGHQMFLQDAETIAYLNVHTLIIDDVDGLRHRKNRTAYAIKRQARSCERVVILNGTPLQKHLTELHSILEPLGGHEVFGSESYFKRRYIREEFVSVYNNQLGRRVTTRKGTGYKNLDEFVTKAAPFTLRRTPADINDVDLPVIQSHDVYLDLHPAQRDRYDELRRGVLKVIKAEGTRVSMPDAMARFLYGQQICSGLTTLGETDRPGTSAKLDYIEQLLTGDLVEEKVVVFCQFTRTVEALSDRLTAAGIGHVRFWGRETDKDARQRAIDSFWEDPDCRVLIGTSAIEQSLNLQVSRFLINVDLILNPARMQQLAGRIRRDGSRYKTVYVVNLLAAGTQEEGYLDVLEREQALADFIYGETNQLFEQLSPLALLDLIGNSGR
jgi:SNF2 family DNA or RNA helicase